METGAHLLVRLRLDIAAGPLKLLAVLYVETVWLLVLSNVMMETIFRVTAVLVAKLKVVGHAQKMIHQSAQLYAGMDLLEVLRNVMLGQKIVIMEDAQTLVSYLHILFTTICDTLYSEFNLLYLF